MADLQPLPLLPQASDFQVCSLPGAVHTPPVSVAFSLPSLLLCLPHTCGFILSDLFIFLGHPTRMTANRQIYKITLLLFFSYQVTLGSSHSRGRADDIFQGCNPNEAFVKRRDRKKKSPTKDVRIIFVGLG